MTTPATVKVDHSIAVVIVNYNGEAFIEDCLEALQRQTVQPERVMVIDNASTDASTELVARLFPNVELVCLPENTGFTGGNNHAFQLIEDCNWVALLNPDTIAADSWVARLKQAISNHPECAVFSCRLEDMHNVSRIDGTGDQYHVAGLGWRRDHGAPSHIKRSPDETVFAPCAAAALYQLSAVRAAGMFDTSYFCYNEDTDLMFRMRLQGKYCLHIDDCVVRHAGSGITGYQSDFSIYHGHRNLVWTYFKNMPTTLMWLYLPQHLLLNLVSVVYFSAKGRYKVILRAKWHALRGLPEVFGKRKQIQSTRSVGCSELSGVMVRNPLAAYFNRHAS